MFRAEFLSLTSIIVEHSRYLLPDSRRFPRRLQNQGEESVPGKCPEMWPVFALKCEHLPRRVSSRHPSSESKALEAVHSTRLL
jgi:hypothetical protein